MEGEEEKDKPELLIKAACVKYLETLEKKAFSPRSGFLEQVIQAER